MNSIEEQQKTSKVHDIKQLVSGILSKESDFGIWHSNLNSLAAIFGDATGVRVDDDMSQSDAAMVEGGKAISPVQAAKCINEVLRTRQFWRANLAAVKDLLAQKQQISILYAGTGPYGSILLPLLPLLNQGAIKLVCLDIHQQNLDALKKVVDLLEPQLAELQFVCADATTWQPDSNSKYDLIISETMNAFLHSEPQVSIFAHLQQFLAEDGHLIPQEIGIDLWLPEHRFYDELAGKICEVPEQKVCRVMQLDRSLAKKIHDESLSTLDISVQLPESRPYFTSLLLRTEIKIYNNVVLTLNQCSLNRDKRFSPAGGIRTNEPVHLQYHILHNPDWTLTCSGWLDNLYYGAPEPVNSPLNSDDLFQIWWQSVHIVMNKPIKIEPEQSIKSMATIKHLGIQYGDIMELLSRYSPTYSEFVCLLEEVHSLSVNKNTKTSGN